jgi:hypothetical protein
MNPVAVIVGAIPIRKIVQRGDYLWKICGPKFRSGVPYTVSKSFSLSLFLLWGAGSPG